MNDTVILIDLGVKRVLSFLKLDMRGVGIALLELYCGRIIVQKILSTKTGLLLDGQLDKVYYQN